MPRFPAFNRRKSNADSLENASVAGPSFRVLDRSELAGGSRNSDGSLSQRTAIKQSQSMPAHLAATDAASEDDNLFANLNGNRGSGSSNTTQTNSTDNSSRHSNVSTTPSSADLTAQQQQLQHQQQQEDWRLQNKKLYGDVPVPPIPKSNSASSFLKSAGRTFSFGTQRKPLAVSPLSDATPPHTPVETESGRDRAMTASTVTTATPPKLEEEFDLDLGGDFGKMLGVNVDKRASVATVRDDGLGRPVMASRALTGNRLNQPAPPRPEEGAAKDGPSPYLWGNQRSTDRLLYSNSPLGASTNTNENAAPPVPRHAATFNNRPQIASDATGSTTPGPTDTRPPLPSSTDSGLKRTTAIFGRRRSTIDYAAEAEDEDANLLRESLSTVNRFLAGGSASSSKPSASPASRLRLTDDKTSLGYKQVPADSNSPVFATSPASQDEDLFTANRSIAQSTRISERFTANKISSPQNKVMTPAQFERYRKDKEYEDRSKAIEGTKTEASDAEEDDNYDDDEDEAEKARQAAKQRRKQEAHMTVYRQQMMKVTGEAASGTPARGSLAFSASTPNLTNFGAAGAASGHSPQVGAEAEADEDEEVPLAILAAHGFPNKNRPPTRLSSMMSNPNLRAAAAPSYHRSNSSMGDAAAAAPPPAAGAGGRLPPFARNLPQDPYGLVNSNTREAFNLAGGAPAGGHVPPGGLVGVIATEERSRAMRRGSPALDAINKPMPSMGTMGSIDPMGGIPPHMMYPGMGHPQQMLTPGDQAQIQMSQQMQQFMQMQMQFMQMMTANNGAMPAGANPMGMSMGPGMGMAGPDMPRNSFADNASTMDGPYARPEMGMRTMSLVQPSSASWIQPLGQTGFAPSIRVQGVNGYTASIAPSERSNVGLPGRYRPVSQMPNGSQQQQQQQQQQGSLRKSMSPSEALGTPADGANRNSNASSMSPSEGNTANSRGPSPTGWDHARKHKSQSPLNNMQTKPAADDDEDDEEGWAAMKAKRDKKRSMWKSKKTLPSEIGALIS